MREIQETQVRTLGILPGEGNGNPLLPGEPHGQRSLVGYSPQGLKESDTTEDDLACTLSILGASKLLNAWTTSQYN